MNKNQNETLTLSKSLCLSQNTKFIELKANIDSLTSQLGCSGLKMEHFESILLLLKQESPLLNLIRTIYQPTKIQIIYHNYFRNCLNVKNVHETSLCIAYPSILSYCQRLEFLIILNLLMKLSIQS